MKTKYMKLILFLIFLVGSFSLQAQLTDKFDLNIRYEDKSNGKIDITVKVDDYSSAFTFYLYDKEPWNGGKIIKESKHEEGSEYTFKNVVKTNYFIFAVNEDKKGIGKEFKTE